MNQKTHYTILRAFSEVRVQAGRKDPSKNHGFQTCGIVKGEGRVEEFQQYFDPSKASHFLPPGDYEVRATGIYLDRDGRLQMEREFVPLAKSKAA
ncbi:hypothetical protein [Dyella japonica]|uniref:Single-stranded DNA-binding protein n=1 Tax=Dyella japonica TaxID=231455 RepID=A0ABV2JPA4_9GAMM